MLEDRQAFAVVARCLAKNLAGRVLYRAPASQPPCPCVRRVQICAEVHRIPPNSIWHCDCQLDRHGHYDEIATGRPEAVIRTGAGSSLDFRQRDQGADVRHPREREALA